MILVTGGSGFIGSHTVRALHEMGEKCILFQRRTGELPAQLADLPVAVAQGDVTDLASLLEVGTRHKITGIVHLAGSMPWPPTSEPPVDATRKALGGLLNIVQAAQKWGVKRVGVASTIGVYSGVASEGALREDMPLPMSAPHLIPTFKKIGELLNEHLSSATGIELINYRISGTWGPGGHDDPFFPAPALIHAAVRGTKPDLSRLVIPAYAGNALDLCYVKDTGRAIAILQLAERLNYRTYNVASGRATTNAEVVAAIKTVVPDAQLELPTGKPTPHNYLDISRLQQDTGYQPAYGTQRAAENYITWLRAGNAR
ncbi:epimerase [Cystobacter fuscus]|uniref:Epimerase n=1 Tax=Cystobacter fuscus TaxID=43 RepID=A0A250JC74_9BACT|nr:NAD(P)-dependent oxidoreductase [Cystobacter fuscus]ATB41485.1 epimerase [Cystobacter fuscus]